MSSDLPRNADDVSTTQQSHRPMILLAEDDDEMRAVLALHLKREGYDVTECRNGMELVSALDSYLETRPSHKASSHFDLIISDIRMPGVFGLSVVKGGHEYRGFPPSILITAFGDEQTHETARQCGVQAVFNKPFEMSDLLEKVREVLGRRQPT